MADFGGEMQLDIGGQLRTLRGAPVIRGVAITTEQGTNQNGTRYRTGTPRAPECDFTLELPVTAETFEGWMREKSFNATITAPFIGDVQRAGMQFLFTDAAFVGDPEVDLATGEVTGFTIHANKYRQLAG